VACYIADALDIGDRGPAEFHDKTSHGRRLLLRQCAPAAFVSAGA
jgi:hypothetical protein